MRWWLAALIVASLVLAAIDTFHSHNANYDQPTPENSWLLSMKYDTAWVSPLVWCLRQGSLGLMVSIGFVQVGWGLWHWRGSKRTK